jgi:K+/H+ antiporter YhaU regulatory subunit KhtT
VAITSRPLPGSGVCREIDLQTGRRIGVVAHRDGRRDLVIVDDEGGSLFQGRAGTSRSMCDLSADAAELAIASRT